jgi:hypothetical protein
MSTRVAGDASRSFGIASRPLVPGIVTSMRSTSGLCSIMRKSASSAVDASSTTTISSSRSSNARSPDRTTA